MSSRLTDKQIIGYCRLGYAPFFQGFNVSLKLTTSDGSIIDQYNFHVDSTDGQRIYAYTSLRPGTISTTISITWSTNKKNIPAPNPKTTTPAGTGSTPTQSPTTTAPKLPADCDEVEDKTSGIQIIYPDGINPISVRGTLKNISFDLPYANYTDWFGESGIGKNFWMGLDSMNAMSNNGKSYNLQIDLCCGRQLRAKQIFHGFTVGTKTNQYRLTATADLPGIAKDIGAPFATQLTYNLQKSKPECDQFEYYDDNNVGPSGYG
ncbi:Protein CBG24478 [Caenorhabditis briggsae]|uniref:Protein CBG24478 n=1 Tax=Caenorhabditis briggsae TaxID=6238 RepID=A8WKT0_CAEBR|nr:Protein CBG24478 [Caenorhabditis briggsae]CAP21075.2 Protein CBG24478 [Caenorhabditis briggsae]